VVTLGEPLLQNIPLKISVINALAGALWILLSERRLHLLVTDQALGSRLSLTFPTD
jgi:hypothetical protein